MEEIPNSEAYYIGWGEPFCFACRSLFPEGPTLTVAAQWSYARKYLQLAHLQDYYIQQADDVSDVVPLCLNCHKRMPAFDTREEALAWVDSPSRRKERYALVKIQSDELLATAEPFSCTPGLSSYREEAIWKSAREIIGSDTESFFSKTNAILTMYSVEKAYENSVI